MQFVGRFLCQIAIEEFDHQKSSFSHLQIQQKRFDVSIWDRGRKNSIQFADILFIELNDEVLGKVGDNFSEKFIDSYESEVGPFSLIFFWVEEVRYNLVGPFSGSFVL